MQMVDSEAKFESDLIKHLQNIGGTKQWQYRPDIKTTEGLWANFRHILERNNSGQLNGKPLTDEEFNQVKQEIIRSCSSPYKAGQWLYGFNGVTQIQIQRDDSALDPSSSSERSQSVFLTVFDQSQVGAGNTVYQIVNQIERKPVRAGMKSRRFDTTLLINGLPIIQIEEKAIDHSADEALRQEERYIREGQYGGIFSTLQILVGMTPADCKYMAMTDADHFSLDFAFRWQKENGDPAYSWREFTDLMLSIPMAHQMATSYMVLDGSGSHSKLIVMRPYQVYATRRVIKAIKEYDFAQAKAKGIGYVWHTTGSGKTITSFKTAWLASRLPNVDKVIFLVDRIALTRQTFEKYRAYDPDASDESSGVVSDTRNVFDLGRRLRSRQSGNSIIVTSIQKMGDLCKRNSFKPYERRCVFICDEAHRSTNGQMLQDIQKKFPFSAWVGYTGTPIFDDDTTAKVFGPCLHSYTIKQGIADRNVLGFKVDFEHTLDSDEIEEKLLPTILEGKHPGWSKDQIRLYIARMEPQEVDSFIDSGVYDGNAKHVAAVVKNILDHWDNRSVDGRYSALLTTHVRSGASTPMAMMYFDEFLKQNKEREKEGKKPLTVAVTFSYQNNNKEGQDSNNSDLGHAMKVYNSEFGTHFDYDSVPQYFADVSSRLAGMDPGSGNGKAPKLDLVIVVDQLLTGFDAPKLNTLYVDRTLSGASLIQAYSRTNRIDDNQYKPFGRIVNFRWPETSKELMDDALRVYANSGSANTGDISKDDSRDDDGVLVDLNKVKERVIGAVNILRHLTNNLTNLDPQDTVTRRECVQELRIYNRGVTALRQDEHFYDENHPDDFLHLLTLEPGEESKLIALANNLRKHGPEQPPCRNCPPALDLNFHVEHVGEERVNYSYLEKLLAAYLNAVVEKRDDADSTYNMFLETAAQLDDEQRPQAERLTRLAGAARTAPDGKIEGITYPVEAKDVSHLAVLNDQRSARTQVLQFREKWGLQDIDGAKQTIDELIHQHTPGHDDLKGQKLNTLLGAVTKQRLYQQDATDENIREMSIFKYRNELIGGLQKLADKVVTESPEF
jgi:type I restriction enzyme R subunit